MHSFFYALYAIPFSLANFHISVFLLLSTTVHQGASITPPPPEKHHSQQGMHACMHHVCNSRHMLLLFASIVNCLIYPPIAFTITIPHSWLFLVIFYQPSAFGDAQALPAPKPVSLNHLYCTAIKDGMMVLGVTERYRNKHVTKVFYSTMPGTSNSLSA